MHRLLSSTLWSGRSVGLLGGSFNPAHEGHRHISLQALKRLGLDAVWWLVSPQNPLKPAKGMAPCKTRLEQAAKTARHPKISVTDIERELGTAYTADTLKKLKQLHPSTRFIWLMGGDNLRQIHLWNDWQDIFALVPVCVVDRPPADSIVRASPALERFRPFLVDQSAAPTLKTRRLPAWTILHAPLNPLSASLIRKEKRKA